MASLSGQTIQSTYPGLLKLETATTGITSNLQSIQDGLGNNTGLRIKTNQLESNNIISLIPLKARYYGNGYNNASATPYSNLQNVIIATPFYDKGSYSYSAMSFNVLTGSTDIVEIALYTSQMINPSGIFPYEPVISGLTANTTTSGIKTITFPTPISFSGYGAGMYYLVYKITAASSPVFRVSTSSSFSSFAPFLPGVYGFSQSLATNVFATQYRFNNAGSTLQVFTGATTFDNPYSTSLPSLQSTSQTASGNAFGFLLHTVDA
jgi:hypothetical protein